jgi:hypothetical protein
MMGEDEFWNRLSNTDDFRYYKAQEGIRLEMVDFHHPNIHEPVLQFPK